MSLRAAQHMASTARPSAAAFVMRRSVAECVQLVDHTVRDIRDGFSVAERDRGHLHGVGGPHGGALRETLPIDALRSARGQLLALGDALRRIALPRRNVVHEVADFPLAVLREVRQRCSRRFHAGVADDAVIDEFADWVEMCLPTSPQPLLESSHEAETVPFVELWQCVQSFCRYHNGIHWGRENHHGGCIIHPWHRVCTPQHHSEQMAYVHFLQWMMDSSHRPLWASGAGDALADRKLSAVDVGCHSGYTTELLLKAGVRRVLCVDRDERALDNTEATVREHVRAKRGGGRSHETAVTLMRCPLLPGATAITEPAVHPGRAESAAPQAAEERRAVNLRAARQRRRRGRLPQSPSELEQPQSPKRPEPTYAPFDVLCYHPPVETDVLPSPFVAENGSCTLSALGGHPHATEGVLSELLEGLGAHGLRGAGDAGSLPLLRDGGIAAFVLPRSFSPLAAGGALAGLTDVVMARLEASFEVLHHRQHSLWPLLEDAATHDASVFSRAGVWSSSGCSESPFHSSVGRAQRGGCLGAGLPCVVNPKLNPSLYRQVLEGLTEHYQEQSADLLIVRRKRGVRAVYAAAPPGSGPRPSHASAAPPRAPGIRPPTAADFTETLEYNEYLPQVGPGNPFHWSALVPSYSYLDSDFRADGAAAATPAPQAHAQPSVLATGYEGVRRSQRTQVGAGAAPPSAEGSVAHADEASRRFEALFSPEMKQRRQKKMRRMATEPSSKQEWFLDEKFVKSEAARLEVMNEVLRTTLREPQ